MSHPLPTVFRLLLAAFCAMAAWPAFSVDGITASQITLGMSTPLSGPTGAYGQQMREGVEVYFAKTNAAGGVQGRKLQLVALDDGYEVDRAVSNTKRLIEQERVFALLGFYGTASTTAVLPVLDQTGVPLVGTVSGAEVLRSPVNRHMFHLRASYGDETAAVVKNLVTVGVRRIAVVYQDDGFGQAGLLGVKAALQEYQLQPVAVASLPRNSVEVAPAVAAIAGSEAQAVVMATLYRPTAAFIRQMRHQGEKPYFVALSPVGTDQLVAELGAEDSRGIQVAQVIPYPWADKLDVVREYKRAMAAHAKGSPLSYYGLEGYLNAKLMVSALERAGPLPTREKLIAALRSGPFDLGGYRIAYLPGSNSGSAYVEISVIGAGGRILN
ncbi:ABC transporter substrate-binding protein [Aquabacterium sp. A7-Y]|uniref:ABC transporter substrate-binding protein n=1 Tax=Aquabacterium sp. A7-Y TaxID=1349605 RepID=UPI00223D4C0E|nr:ABC transporter substrate-binding protein [Aquabacterium sp. A7-Y]MCW7538052.1 ABC transporter substrate-binding protein [Aquabacterium sp. A7-Y]